jgi:hypothetical protein
MKCCLPLVFGWRYAGRYLQLSNVQSTQFCSAAAEQHWRHLEGNYYLNLNSTFENGRQITGTKAYRKSVSLYCATNIISQLMFAFTGSNRFISMESLWRHFTNSKTARDAYLCLDLSIHGNRTSIHLVTQSL